SMTLDARDVRVGVGSEEANDPHCMANLTSRSLSGTHRPTPDSSASPPRALRSSFTRRHPMTRAAAPASPSPRRRERDPGFDPCPAHRAPRSDAGTRIAPSVSLDRDAPERRRHRDRSRRQPLRRGGDVRGDPRHRAQVRGPGQGQPGSLILSAEMMLRHIGWTDAAELIISSLGATISDQQVTYDLARLMAGAHEISTSAFAHAMIERI